MNEKQKYVYLLKIPEKSIYKIGVSKDVEKRIKQLQTGNYEQITLVHKFKSNYPYKIESILHGMYKFKRIEGEWYDMSAKEEENFIGQCEMYERNFSTLKTYNNSFIKF